MQHLKPEDLKNLTPEQLQELQKQNCVFCHIISGKIHSKKVYEDERVLAILDINPASQGHVIIVPKTHATIMPQLSREETAHVAITTKIISHAILKGMNCGGTSIFIAQGIAAGQRAGHVIVHVIPREKEDGILLNPEDGEKTSAIDQTSITKESPTKEIDLDELSRLMK